MKKLSLISLVIALVIALVAGLILTGCDGPSGPAANETANQFFKDQPDSEHSNICCQSPDDPKDHKNIIDVDFAKELCNALHDESGKEIFHSMIITFTGCFGGGMIDDVANAFVNTQKPISMTSASRYDERSNSRGSWFVNGFEGYGPWTKAQADAHPGMNNNPTEAEAFDESKASYESSKTPQLKTLKNGGDIKLGGGIGGSGATNYHAILFVGSPWDKDAIGFPSYRHDFWSDIVIQHQMLTDSGYPAANIITFFGDGTLPEGENNPQNIVPKPATKDNLVQAIKDLKDKNLINENEQLYIYVGGHGSTDQSYNGTQPKHVPPQEHKDSNNTFEFSPLPTYMVEALQSPENNSGPYIALNVKSSGNITSNWEVFFNDNALAVNGGNNTFPGGGDEAALRFLINPEVINLTGDNDIWLRNSQSTDDPVEVEIYFSMGDIATTTNEI